MPAASRVLGVDDNPRNLAILKKALGQAVEFVTAASGEEALEVARRFKPDIVLLDIMMPGLDGYETCRRLREYRELAGVKIIMVSAKAMTQERMEGYAAGADDYVIKPFDPDELLAKVRVYLRLKSTEEVALIKSDLLDLLGHETGTPLTGILGALEMLRGSGSLTAEQDELVEVAEASAVRLRELVKRVNLITGLKARAIEIRNEAVDLHVLVASAADEIRDAARQARVTLETELAGAPVAGDPGLLAWVIEALIDNAVRMSPNEGVVSVRVESDASGTHVVIADQGPGFPPDVLAHAFDEFVVADIMHHKRGSGLSLAAARLIVEQHRGTLSVASEAGHGAIFTLHLPAVPAMRAAA